MGFHPTLAEFTTNFQNLPEESFVSRFTDPVLVIEMVGKIADGTDFRTFADSCSPKGEVTDEDSELIPFVVPLVKSDRNVFTDMITLGRASNNDVVIPYLSVSKLHAFFQKDYSTGSINISDAGSTFGTKVNGKPVEKGAATALESMATIEIAKSIRTTFFSPADFYKYMQLMARRSK
jgi:hypothetical protein